MGFNEPVRSEVVTDVLSRAVGPGTAGTIAVVTGSSVQVESAPSAVTPGARRSPGLWLELLGVLLAGIVPTVVAIRSLGLGWRDWTQPWIGGDMLTTYALAKNLSNGNWFLFNPDVGYPGFQDLGHYPVPDLLNVAAVGILSWLLPSPIAAVNVFAIGTFFAVGAVTYVVFRRLGVEALFALLASWVFALLPWHFIRVHAHVFLSNYVSIPLALLLVDAVARGTLERRRRASTALWYGAAALVVGLSGIYYALMATVLILTVLVVRVAEGRAALGRSSDCGGRGSWSRCPPWARSW